MWKYKMNEHTRMHLTIEGERISYEISSLQTLTLKNGAVSKLRNLSDFEVWKAISCFYLYSIQLSTDYQNINKCIGAQTLWVICISSNTCTGFWGHLWTHSCFEFLFRYPHPIWIFIFHSVRNSITNSGITATPCLRSSISATKIHISIYTVCNMQKYWPVRIEKGFQLKFHK